MILPSVACHFWSLNRDYAFDRSMFLIIYLSVKQVGTIIPSAAFLFLFFCLSLNRDFLTEVCFWISTKVFSKVEQFFLLQHVMYVCFLSRNRDFLTEVCFWISTKGGTILPSAACHFCFVFCPWTETVLRRKLCLTGWSLPMSSTWLLLLVACSATSSTTSTSM